VSKGERKFKKIPYVAVLIKVSRYTIYKSWLREIFREDISDRQLCISKQKQEMSK